MSSFLCFVCHSTVNADTNEDTREKYREVIGMNLCPDSHLCFICCHFLNKMCLFKSICLKRSLEYPVLFSEKGTINLQRSDIQVAILCPEDICLQHLNTRYHFCKSNDNSQSDFENNYCQLQDDTNYETGNGHMKTEPNEEFFNENYKFTAKDDAEDDFYKEQAIITTVEPVRVAQNEVNDTKREEITKNDAVQLELHNNKPEVNEEDTLNTDSEEADSIEGMRIEENTSDNLTDQDNVQETDEYTTDIEGQRSKKDFIKITYSVKQQKMELVQARKEEKFKEADFKCYSCAVTFHFKFPYQAHMMRHEESNGEYRCAICTLRFANPSVLRSHLANHAERYKCTRCSVLVRARQRQTHLIQCRGKETGSVACHLCGRVFQGSSHLQQHIKRYHQSKTSNRSYLCNVCGKSYNNQAAVRTHMITHINKKFACDQCTSTFSSPYTLNQHRKTHTTIEKELHYCATCKIGYSSKKGLLAHRRNALAHKDTVYKCTICARICPSQASLDAHSAAVHVRTKHLTCALCPAKYSTRKALMRHMRSHKAEGPKLTPLCHACGESFKSTGTLKRHLKNVCEKDKIDEELTTYFEQ